MRELTDHRIEASVNIRKRYKDTAKPVVANNNWCRTSRVCWTARHPVRAGVLNSVYVATQLWGVRRVARIPGVAGMKSIHIDGACKLAATATLIADRGLAIMDRLGLWLHGVKGYLMGWFVWPGAEYVRPNCRGW